MDGLKPQKQLGMAYTSFYNKGLFKVVVTYFPPALHLPSLLHFVSTSI